MRNNAAGRRSFGQQIFRNITGKIQCKSFGDGEYEQIDIKSYLEECGKSDTELDKVLRSAVKYSGSSSYNSNGLAMYFPYDYPDYYAEIKTETDKFGYNGYNSFSINFEHYGYRTDELFE